MKVKYLGESSTVGLIDDKDYEVISIERDWYRIVDETDEDYLHPPAGFDVVEPSDGSVPPATRCSLPGPAADWAGQAIPTHSLRAARARAA